MKPFYLYRQINVRYQLSKYHSKSQKIVTDEERLYELVPMLMINFKYAIVTEELKHMLYALQDPALAHDEEWFANHYP